MAGNRFGKHFSVSTFGESHGPALGGVLDGCPAGLKLDLEAIQKELARRRPGQSKLVTQRKEPDEVRFLSGIFEEKTTGTPIGFVIENENQRSRDYGHIKDSYRPSHADYTFDAKYGHRDYRGGGRSSARETAARVVAGAIGQQLLATAGITVHSYVSAVGDLILDTPYDSLDFDLIESNPVRCPDPAMAEQMAARIDAIRKDGDTIGGVVTGVIKGVPPGLGEPVFDKLHAELGKAMLSINAVKGFEYGSGFAGTVLKGSQHNDAMYSEDGQVRTRTNRSGGIQGGISNGEDIVFRVAFKPVATIMKPQESVDREGNSVSVEGRGRHDPCVLPRAVPIVDAMAALVITDHYLRQRLSRL